MIVQFNDIHLKYYILNITWIYGRIVISLGNFRIYFSNFIFLQTWTKPDLWEVMLCHIYLDRKLSRTESNLAIIETTEFYIVHSTTRCIHMIMILLLIHPNMLETTLPFTYATCSGMTPSIHTCTLVTEGQTAVIVR